MMTRLFLAILVTVFSTSCASHSPGQHRGVASEEGGVSKESDLELAQAFAPVVINEYSEAHPIPSSDLIDFVYYDVAQTATHVYISYHIMKSFSEDPTVQHVVDTDHWVDSEDVFLILQKTQGGLPQIVLMETNAHGNRMTYVGSDISPRDVGRLPKMGQNNDQHLQAHFKHNYWLGVLYCSAGAREVTAKVKSSYLGYVQDYSDAVTLNALGRHPLIVSAAASHALYGASLEAFENVLEKKLFPYTLSFEDDNKALQSEWANRGAHTGAYSLVALEDDLPLIHYSQEVRKKNPSKVVSCKSHMLSTSDGERSTPALPTHIDTAWYLAKYHPELEAFARRDRGKWFDALSDLEADLYYVHGQQGKEKLIDCPRLDPAEIFRRDLPATFEDQNASRIYTRYRLLDVKTDF